MDVSVRGAEDFAALAKRIKQHADAKALRRELYSGINRATKDLRTDMKANITPSLPARGGLAALVARDATLRVRNRTGAATAGVQIVARGRKYNLHGIHGGTIRHPVFGRGMVTQTVGVDEGFLQEPFDKAAPEIRDEILKVMADIARKVVG
jgi:hypothetical protein